MKHNVDVVRIRENSIQLNGWVIGKTPDSVPEFAVLDAKGRPVEFRYVSTRRDDVSQIYYGKTYDRDFGFDIQFPYERGRDYWLVIRCDGRKARIRYNETLAFLEEEERAGRVFIIRPQEKVQVGRIEKNREKLDALYQIGLEDGRNAMADMKAYLEK